jgi:hypothetical protein
MAMTVNLHDRRINHGELHIGIVGNGVENSFENIGFHPAPVALEDRVPVAQARRKVTPGASRARDPKHRFHKQPIVPSAAAWVTRLSKTMRLHLRPLGVCQYESIHGKLLLELESHRKPNRNPESQQTLERDEIK